MSLILKGIDLPKGQSLMVFIANNGAVVCSGEDGVTTTEAIQIPKGHGYIIDESKAVVTETIDGYYEITAPTILEGEERCHL